MQVADWFATNLSSLLSSYTGDCTIFALSGIAEHGWNAVSRVLFQRRELTEFCGKLGEFCQELAEFAFAHK